MALPVPASDRTALVTGASSGIGVELARELAGRGHGVTLVARRVDRLAELAEELSATGVRAEVMSADLADADAREALPERVDALGLKVDILVNNAGVSTFGPVDGSSPEAELAMIELDVMAVADLTTRFLPGMVRRRSGAVLNVASTAAFQPLPGQAGYGACKAFVLSYTRSLAGELRGTGVAATVLCPGPVDTEFGADAGWEDGEAEAVLPQFMWESAASVAGCGINALERGRQVAIPGPANRALAAAAHLAPKTLLVPLIAGRHPGLKRGST